MGTSPTLRIFREVNVSLTVDTDPTTAPFVIAFADGDMSMSELMGGKGANLAEMTRLGLTVPHGFAITTAACRHYPAFGREPASNDLSLVMRPTVQRPWRRSKSLRTLTFSTSCRAMEGSLWSCGCLTRPLHEFLPDLTELSVKVALKNAAGKADSQARRQLAGVRWWHEANPVLGLRGGDCSRW